MKAPHGLSAKLPLSIWLFAALAGHAVLATAEDAADAHSGFPYEAYVYVDEADVVAGPGYRYYVTTRLPRGTRVEVYQEDPSGWLAIRPPEGSFSWVPADFVERHVNHPEVGGIKSPVGSWVGTTVERVAQHRQQITLQKGELVHILGEKEVLGPEGQAQRWFKIAPPAGEFRWIHVRDVRRGKPPPDGLPQALPAGLPDREGLRPGSENADHRATAEPVAGLEEGEEDHSSRPQVRHLGASIPLHDLHDAARSSTTPVAFVHDAAAERGGSPDGFVPRRRRSGGDEGLALASTTPSANPAPAPRTPESARSFRKTGAVSERSASVDDLAAASIPARRREGMARSSVGGSSSGTIGIEEMAQRIEQLEVELALMLARDRSQWNLAALREQALVLVERGADPAWRGRARMLVDRIEQLADAFESSLPSRPLVPAAAAVPSEGAVAARRAAEEVRYDAQGWLKEVVSRQANKPPAPYAVVDAQGRPVCFVSPAPGLNLHRYLNRQVGLFGRRGWLAELQKPHLVAERVIELDR